MYLVLGSVVQQLLLRKKAAEELKKEQERKAAERRRIIEERCGKPKNVDDANEGKYLFNPRYIYETPNLILYIPHMIYYSQQLDICKDSIKYAITHFTTRRYPCSCISHTGLHFKLHLYMCYVEL